MKDYTTYQKELIKLIDNDNIEKCLVLANKMKIKFPDKSDIDIYIKFCNAYLRYRKVL